MSKNYPIELKRDHSEIKPEEPSKISYPSFLVDSESDLSHLPKTGEMTIKFSKTNEGYNENDGDKRHTATIQVEKILSCSGRKEGETIDTSDMDEEKEENDYTTPNKRKY